MNLFTSAVCVDSTSNKTQKTHVQPIAVNTTATFPEILKQLNDFYKVTDGKSVRVGQLKDEAVTSFKGKDLGTYMKTHGLYPSTTKLYLETEEKFGVEPELPVLRPEDGGDGDAPNTAAASTSGIGMKLI